MAKPLRLWLGFAASVVLCTTAGAQTIYKSEKNGVTTYSTKPSADSNVVKLPELSVIPSHTNHGSASTGAMPNLPAPPVPDSMIPGNNPNLLPPPPPSLGAKPAAKAPTREELQVQLSKARVELAAQEEVRLGDERNYQKKLDRVKPFQDRVDELTRALSVTP